MPFDGLCSHVSRFASCSSSSLKCEPRLMLSMSRHQFSCAVRSRDLASLYMCASSIRLGEAKATGVFPSEVLPRDALIPGRIRVDLVTEVGSLYNTQILAGYGCRKDTHKKTSLSRQWMQVEQEKQLRCVPRIFLSRHDFTTEVKLASDRFPSTATIEGWQVPNRSLICQEIW